jgi:hypothetical protein
MGKGKGPATPNPNCEKCKNEDIACIDCYMRAGGYDD